MVINNVKLKLLNVKEKSWLSIACLENFDPAKT